ncbi:MAG: ABC transporter ATP-binding protein [archaeon]|nr:ABC transporter ATP-binding protein [archaeon]
MASIEMNNIVKRYGSLAVVNNVSFVANSGKFVTLLGPSGCGKTTLLKCIAGLETPSNGSIKIGESIVFSSEAGIFIPPNKRKIGMVFQSYALWPHMNTFDNIAYGLAERKWNKERTRDRVREIMALLNLQDLEQRYPSQLSGGQQQRVALGRAIAYPSELLLLDEPLSNIDAKLREKMRFEIKEVQKKIGVTTIYVTHDRREALSMSDQIIVMSDGELVAQGTSTNLWNDPRSAFVADFLGLVNVFEGTVAGKMEGHMIVRTKNGLSIKCESSTEFEVGQQVEVFADPYNVEFLSENATPQSGNVWKAEVCGKSFMGSETDYEVVIEDKRLFIRSRHNVSVGNALIKIDPKALIVTKQ